MEKTIPVLSIHRFDLKIKWVNEYEKNKLCKLWKCLHIEDFLVGIKWKGILIFKWLFTVKESHYPLANDSNCKRFGPSFKKQVCQLYNGLNVPRLLLLFQKTENYMIACKWHIQFHTLRMLKKQKVHI